MKQQILNAITAMTFLLAFSTVGLILFWLNYPYSPNTINSITTIRKEVQAGARLDYIVDYCKSMAIPAQSTRSFVDGIIFTTDTITTNNVVGCHRNTTSIVVPQEMASGPYTLRTVWVYKVNPIREITVTKDSNVFEVLGSDIERQIEQE